LAHASGYLSRIELTYLADEFGELAGVFGERADGYVVTLEHGDVEIAEGAFGLVFEETAVAQAEVLAAGQCGEKPP
ncbi:MAG: hypothetical protein WCL32_24800, partial [Planctomycetota bacterium]